MMMLGFADGFFSFFQTGVQLGVLVGEPSQRFYTGKFVKW